jgi:hypothetical protein
VLAGDVIAVTARHDDGWAHGTVVASAAGPVGRTGAFPLNFTARPPAPPLPLQSGGGAWQ